MYQCTHDGNCGMDVHTRVQIIAVTNIGSDHAYSVAYSKRRSRRQLKNILNWNIRKTLTSARNFHKNSWEGDKFSLSWLLLRCLSFLSSSNLFRRNCQLFLPRPLFGRRLCSVPIFHLSGAVKASEEKEEEERVQFGDRCASAL